MLLALLLCCGPGPGAGPGEGPAAEDGTPRLIEISGLTAGAVEAPCTQPGSPSITDVTWTQPWHENELLIEATTSAPAALAAICTLDDDPDERHLARDSTSSTGHALRLGGLLADSDYTCELFPTCPRSLDAPTVLEVHTGPALDGLPGAEVESSGQTGGEYILTNWIDAYDYSTGLLLVYDRQGRVRWWYQTPDDVGPSLAFHHLGGARFGWGGGWPPIPAGRPREVDVFDGEVWDSGSLMADADIARFHHDGKRLDDGRWATLEQLKVTGSDGEFYGFQVRILNPETGATDLSYSAQRALDEGHLTGGSGDEWHTNWMDTVDLADHRELIISLRNSSQIISVDADTGDWRWSFGAGGDFTLLDATGAPLGDEGYPSWQHAPEFDGRTLLVYDNGWGAGRSRVVSYTLDTDAMTATLDWSWTEDGWYEGYLGSVETLPDGHVLVCEGHGEPYSTSPGDHSTFVEVDPGTGDKLWQMMWTDVNDQAYRASWADPCDLFANAALCTDVREEIRRLEAGLE